MEIPRFFAEPHFKKEIDFMNLNKTLDHDIFDMHYQCDNLKEIKTLYLVHIYDKYKYLNIKNHNLTMHERMLREIINKLIRVTEKINKDTLKS